MLVLVPVPVATVLLSESTTVTVHGTAEESLA